MLLKSRLKQHQTHVAITPLAMLLAKSSIISIVFVVSSFAWVIACIRGRMRVKTGPKALPVGWRLT